jgi:hypothetical protein
MKPRSDTRSEVKERQRPIAVRGGVSLPAVLTGVVVAFGAMFLLSALVGGILAATGVDASEVENGTQEATVGAGIAFVVAVFLAYLWGGYTAGRMSRGAGFLNGLLVPVLALIVGAVVAAVVTALGAAANLNLPFAESQLPIEGENLVDFGQLVGIAALVAMFVGGIAGGAAGSRWHTKLERRALEDREVKDREARDREVRDREVTDRAAAERTDETRTAPREPERTDRESTAPAARSQSDSERSREMPPPEEERPPRESRRP